MTCLLFSCVSAQAYQLPIPVLGDELEVQFLTEDAPVQPVRSAPPPVRCIEVEVVELSGNSVLSSEQLLMGQRVSGCLDVEDLFGLAAAVTNAYVEAGYVTTRAFLPEQDLSSGRVEVVVIEGRVEAIEIIENGEVRVYGRAAMPDLVGHLLHLRDVEQGLDQINRLRSKDATISFRPGSEAGLSVIEVAVASRPAWQVRTSVNNAGTGASGAWHSSTTVDFDDIVGQFEQLSLSYKRNLDTDGGREQSHEYRADLSIPLGGLTFRWSGKVSTYISTLNASGQMLTTSGNTIVNRFSFEQLLHRDQMSKTHLTGSYRIEDISNYLEGTLINVSSRALSVGTVELSHSTQMLGGHFYTRGGLHQGLPFHASGGPLAAFTKLEGEMSFSAPLAEGLTSSSRLTGQWSPSALYASEQFSLSDIPGFQRFAHPGASGENGIRLRQELSYMMPFLGDGGDSTLTVFGAVEGGLTFPGPSNGNLTTPFAGAALGVRLAHGNLFGSASWEVPLAAPGLSNRQGTFRVEAGVTFSQF